MKPQRRIYFLTVTSVLIIVLPGCSFFSNRQKHETESATPVNILIYADKTSIAQKVALYLVDNPNLIVIPTADVQMLNKQNIMNFSVVILLPVSVGVNHFPGNVWFSLRDFVRNGGGIIGMHDVLFLQGELMNKIFGCDHEGVGGVGLPSDYDWLPKLSITIHDYSPITQGIPEEFTLEGEHPFIPNINPAIHRLFDMTYKTRGGMTKKYCAGWTYEYGKGKAFFFTPGHAEETRYNPYVIRMISNAVVWMTQNKN